MKGQLTNVNSAECMADFCRIMKFPGESTEQISEFIEFREVTDGTVLISQGKMNYNIYFILSGFGVGYFRQRPGDDSVLSGVLEIFCNIFPHSGVISSETFKTEKKL